MTFNARGERSDARGHVYGLYPILRRSFVVQLAHVNINVVADKSAAATVHDADDADDAAFPVARTTAVARPAFAGVSKVAITQAMSATTAFRAARRMAICGGDV